MSEDKRTLLDLSWEESLMSKKILLNGAGSSGKTSLVSSIQYLSNEQWLTFGVDTFIEMTPYPPPGKDGEYFAFVPGENERGPLMNVLAFRLV